MNARNAPIHWLLFIAVAASLAPGELPGQPSVPTGKEAKVVIESGTLIGMAQGRVLAFRGIPYAAPPVGPLRWMPPQSSAPWQGARSATESGPACPQPVSGNGTPNDGAVTGPTSEDCLTIDVFAPQGAHQAPVLVWVFGGGNNAGANSVSVYDGTSFARDGVILVSMNYRVGALGFLAHPALTRAAEPGQPLVNYGLMDQIAALQWVRRNIASFGGDPHKVTLAGESAGGSDVLALMVIERARGLFQRAIVESGAKLGPPTTLERLERFGVDAFAKLGLGPDATVDQLRAIPANDIVATVRSPGLNQDGRLMVESVREGFERGHAVKIPLIIGWNSYEASVMSSRGASLEAMLSKTAPEELPEARRLYPDPTEGPTLNNFLTDGMGSPTRWIAARNSDGSPTWLYYFSYVQDARKAIDPGARHASEIPFVFDSWDRLSPKLSIPPPTNQDRAVTAVVHSCWVSFAKHARPACVNAPAWPSYSKKTDQLLEFSDHPEVRTHFRKQQLDLVERVMQKVATASK